MEKFHFYSLTFQQPPEIAYCIIALRHKAVPKTAIDKCIESKGFSVETTVLTNVSYLGCMTEAFFETGQELQTSTVEDMDDDAEYDDADEKGREEDTKLPKNRNTVRAIKEVKRVLKEVLDTEDEILMDAELEDDLGIDSLDWGDIQNLLEEEFGIDFGSNREIPTTVRDLVKLVAKMTA